MKDKAIDTNLIIPCDADFFYQPLLVGERAQRRHEPAVAVIALANVVGGCTFDEELRLLKDILSSFVSPSSNGAGFIRDNIPRPS